MAVLDSLRDRLPARAERMWQGFAKNGSTPFFPACVLAALLAAVAGWIAGGLGEPLSRNPVLVAMMFGLLIGNCFQCPDRFGQASISPSATCCGWRWCWWAFASPSGCSPISASRRFSSPAIELVAVLVILQSWSRGTSSSWTRIWPCSLRRAAPICGAAAILAVAAATRARDQFASVAIALITIAGTVALLLYPVAFMEGWLPHLDDRFYGAFVGASIYELAQVYGAAIAVSEAALETATQIKLSKVLMLVPLLMVLAFLRRQSDARSKSAPVPFPWFIVAFVVVMLFNSSMTLHPLTRYVILEVDQFLFLMVMVALGLTTRLAMLREAGGAWRMIGVGVIGLMLSTLTRMALVAPLSASSGVAAPLAAESVMLGSAGGRLFSSMGCAKCHVPALRGRKGEVTLYSDLLLHKWGRRWTTRSCRAMRWGSSGARRRW